MRNFIYNILPFISLIVIFNFIIFLFAEINYYSDYRITPDPAFNSFLFSDSHGLPLDTHTQEFGIYNFSAGSESYVDIKRKLNWLIEHNYNIDDAYITADDHTLSSYRDRGNNNDRSVFYVSTLDQESPYDYITNRYITYFATIFQPKVQSVFKSYLAAKIKSIFNPTTSKHESAERWEALSAKEKNKKSELRKNSQFPSKGKSNKLKKALLDIIALSKKHNFSLIGIKYPLSNTYIDAVNGLGYGADEILLNHGIPVLDYKKLYTNNIEYFSDQDHLNALGGKLFARELFNNSSKTRGTR